MWDKRFGGTLSDEFSSIRQTRDRGFILGGSSFSGISGDKTQSTNGYYDYWLVKTDSLSNKIWDKAWGGTDWDQLIALDVTTDGGYILGGTSSSGIGGDKTEAAWGISDYWILKIDSTGNKVWDKDFGGTSTESLNCIRQANDGGYILGGYSSSGINGDKTQPLWGVAGDYDFWIVKTDAFGNKQWDKDFGTTVTDWPQSLVPTSDGGYLIAGTSSSGINGDKTQSSWGYYDYWIIKIDSLGNKVWDKDFGGTNDDVITSVKQTTDGGYILGGYSFSGISGDKSELNRDPTGNSCDYWIVKTDSLGNKQWDKSFGGTGTEELYDISQTTEGGYLISGDSYSPISGDKTENNLGSEQSWIVKTDSSGNKEWDKTIFTSGHDEICKAIQTQDRCYSIANFTDGVIAGYKTEPSWGSNDYWIVKFCDSTFFSPSSVFTSANHICPGTCTSFLNLSTHATSYEWTFFGASPQTSIDINPSNICYNLPGNYDVQLIASNANGSDTLLLTNYITVYPTPPPQAITQSGDTLFANAGATSYQWYFNNTIINGATNYFYIAPSSGDYNVVATDGNGCEVEAAIFNVVAEIQTTIGNERFSIFPNPVLDKFTIHPELVGTQFTPDSYRDGTANDISIYNLLGERIFLAVDCLPIAIGTLTVDCRPLSSGIYFLEIISDQNTFRTKFVKQ